MIINSNIPSLVTNNALKKANSKTDKSSKHLSTGLRVNSAADDAAGLAIANKMKTQVRGLTMADRNCNDAISLIQTAEGGLSEVQNMLQRMRELAIQGANDTLTTSDRQKIQDECDQLIDEIADTAKKVQFNTKSLLDGKFETFTFQVGPNAGLTLTVDMEEITPYKIGAITDENGNFTSVSQMKSQPTQAIKIGIETNIPSVTKTDATTGETYEEKRVRLATYTEGDGTSANPGMVEATVYTKGDTTMPADTKITETGTYMLVANTLYDSNGNDVTEKFVKEVGDNQTNVGFDLADYTSYTQPILITVTSSTNEEGATIYKESVCELTQTPPRDPNTETLPDNPATYTLSTSDQDDVQKTLSEDGKKLLLVDTKGRGGFTTVESCAYTALLVCDGAINDVSEFRSRLGAVQNRLEYTSSALGTSLENAQTSLSAVEDTDMAAEMTEFTKNNIIVQSGIAMLAQSNQRPNQLLSLLQ